MSDVVLDASALLAVISQEPGATRVTAVLADAAISAVNLSEVVSKLVEKGGSEAAIRALLRRFLLTVVPFDEDQAYEAGLLRAATRNLGLSFGDRACLALARRLGLPAYTAERAWADVKADVQVIVIR